MSNLEAKRQQVIADAERLDLPAEAVEAWEESVNPTLTDFRDETGMIHTEWWWASREYADGETICAYGKTRDEAIVRLAGVLEINHLKKLCSRAAEELRALTGYGIAGWGVQDFPLVDELEQASK